MRTLLAAAVLMMGSAYAQAQDPGMQAAQQAQMAAQQANMQAQQQMQQAQQANQLASQQAMQAAAEAGQPTCCVTPLIAKPTFSVKPGTYGKTLEVKIRDNSRGVTIYYTTDGWTPTVASTRYTGPVTIDATTKLQAIAVANGPYFGRSLVATAEYTVTGTQAKNAEIATVVAASPMATGADSTQKSVNNDRPPVISVDVIPALREGTPVHLTFAADVNSKTADVGDKIALTLTEDIKSGDTVLVAKGAKAEAVVTQAERTGPGGAPGDIAFQVNTLNVNGTSVKLRGGATMEGEPKLPNAAVLI